MEMIGFRHIKISVIPIALMSLVLGELAILNCVKGPSLSIAFFCFIIEMCICSGI